MEFVVVFILLLFLKTGEMSFVKEEEEGVGKNRDAGERNKKETGSLGEKNRSKPDIRGAFFFLTPPPPPNFSSAARIAC